MANGNAFLLQGGPCAEVFDYCTAETIEHEISLLLSMSLILICKLIVYSLFYATLSRSFEDCRLEFGIRRLTLFCFRQGE